MKPEIALSRRRFIGAALTVGGSVLLYTSDCAQASTSPPPTPAARLPATRLNGWIRIAPDGAISVLSRTTELGQGALTSLALIVAEELELDAGAVAVEMAPVVEEFMERTSDGAN